MNIVIFGASGSTGRHITAHAVARGHRVTVFGRDAARLPDPGDHGRKVTGEVRDEEAVARAVRGADAVIVALGAPPSDRSGVRGEGTATVLRAMATHGVRRLVCMSCLGVGDSYEAQGWFTRRIVLDMWLWRVIADHTVQEALIRQSGLDFTIVRPPHLTDAQAGGVRSPIPGHQRPPSSSVGRSDLARFLVDCAETATLRGETFGVCAA